MGYVAAAAIRHGRGTTPGVEGTRACNVMHTSNPGTGKSTVYELPPDTSTSTRTRRRCKHLHPAPQARRDGGGGGGCGGLHVRRQKDQGPKTAQNLHCRETGSTIRAYAMQTRERGGSPQPRGWEDRGGEAGLQEGEEEGEKGAEQTPRQEARGRRPPTRRRGSTAGCQPS